MREKSAYLPKIRVEPERLKRYEKALAKVRSKRPDLSRADWVRAALDNQADIDLT